MDEMTCSDPADLTARDGLGGLPALPRLATLALLSPKDVALMRCLAAGRTNMQIALRSHRSEKTVANQLTRLYAKLGNNLEVSIIGTEDKLTLNSWYAGSGYQVEEFRTSDGHVLIDTQVQNLVQAMASFAPPAPGQTTLPSDYQNSLAPLLAADWR